MVESTSNPKISFLNLVLVSVTAWVPLTPEIRQSIPVTHSSVCLLALRKINPICVTSYFMWIFEGLSIPQL